jgi:NADH-quinone oxidoreductase subunit C
MTDAPIATDLLAVDDALAGTLSGLLGVEVTASRDGNGTLCLDVPAQAWYPAADLLRDRVGLDFFDWLSAVDQSDADPPGLDVVLHVADSYSGRGTDALGRPGAVPGRVRRLLLRTRVADADGIVPSLTSVWPGAAWHERETFEMFGLEFDGYDDGSGLPLRPLLLPEGFEGTPLRKAFMLTARASKPWPGAKEPGESDSHAAPSRRKTLPPGVPEPGTWPREAGDEADASNGSRGPGRAGSGGGAGGSDTDGRKGRNRP